MARHIQWVHVPAVKDASEEEAGAKNTWLWQLLQRAALGGVDFEPQLQTIRAEAEAKYRDVLQQQQHVLAALSGALTTSMAEWANPGALLELKWDSDPNKAVQITQPFARVEASDGAFHGGLTRHGHGFQRSYLLTLLQQLAQSGSASRATLLLGVEEPELYQHPPQARHLASVLESLRDKGVQVLVCTHSPHFISGEGFPEVRLIRRRQRGEGSEVAAASLDAVRALLKEARGRGAPSREGTRSRLHQHLQPWTNEMFFCPVLVLVEGIEDVAYLQAHLFVTKQAADFRKLGCHIVPASKKSHLPVLLATACALGIPTFTVFDADMDQCADPPEGADARERQRAITAQGQHRSDNRALLRLAGHDMEEPLPVETIWKRNLVGWHTNLTRTFEMDFAPGVFADTTRAVLDAQELTGKEHEKNPLFIGPLVEALAEQGHLSKHLDRACESLLAFAQSLRTPTRGQDAASGVEVRAMVSAVAANLAALPEAASPGHPAPPHLPSAGAATERPPTKV